MIPDPKSAVAASTSVLKEFKEFISRGNVVDLAIGVIMGAAFGKIVAALVADVIMPPIGMILKGIPFKDLYLPLDGKHYESIVEAQKHTAIISYGSFINTVIEFIIVSACVFALVKVINTIRRTDAAVPVPPTKSEELLTEIRDLLKKS